MTEAKRQVIRQFSCSAAAEAAGFRLIDWLRAFSFNEHAARIDIDTTIIEAQYGLQ